MLSYYCAGSGASRQKGNLWSFGQPERAKIVIACMCASGNARGRVLARGAACCGSGGVGHRVVALPQAKNQLELGRDH